MESEIFFETNNLQKQHIDFFQQVQGLQLAYLKKGDSELYIQQFLTIDNKSQIIQERNQNQKNNSYIHQTQLFQIKSEHQGNSQSKNEVQVATRQNQQSKSSTLSVNRPSAFHNFQKHLTIALRFLVDIESIKSQKAQIQLAKMLWKAFKDSSVTAKKILHYILGENNQHLIEDKTLQKFGFKQLYENNSESTINQAKSFLRVQTLRQLKEADLLKYTSTRRIKNKSHFIMYFEQFMNEFEDGFLKKRVKKKNFYSTNEETNKTKQIKLCLNDLYQYFCHQSSIN